MLFNNTVEFNAFIAKIGDLDDFYGHCEYDAKEAVYSDANKNSPFLDQKADFYLDNTEVLNGKLKSWLLLRDWIR